MGTLLFLVVVSAIVILFADEASAFFKKWYGIYWVRVTVPLLFISWAWIWNDEVVPFLLEGLQEKLTFLVSAPAQFMPEKLRWISNAVGLFVLASLPAWVMYWRFSREIVTKAQVELLLNVYAFTWVFLAVLLLA